jgi:hypothetical protein
MLNPLLIPTFQRNRYKWEQFDGMERIHQLYNLKGYCPQKP